VEQALRLARQAGCRTAFNPSPMQALPDDWWPMVDLLVVNESEAAQLCGQLVDTPQAAAAAARQLQGRGVARVVVTLGALGAVACDAAIADGKGAGAAPGLACWHEAVPVQAVDTTAAGDTFLGALTVQLARGLGLNEATQWAMRAASICVTRAGAQPSIPYFAEVETLTGATRWSPV